MLDCLVIGGGPAGLTAAIYLGRFRRKTQVVDGGRSRAEWIPRSHNLPGWPEGVEGPVLLNRMRDQARLYGAQIRAGYIQALQPVDGGFTASLGDERLTARTVILATGVLENTPPLDHVADAVKRGVIRTCPICDGYEGVDKCIGVLGDSDHAGAEALFLRTFTSRLSVLLVRDDAQLSDEMQGRLDAAGISVSHVRISSVVLKDEGVTALYAGDGQMHRFDAVYSAFGVTSQTKLARALNARMDDCDRLFVSDHQETSISGLYAAGDLVRGLNQISVANGEAAIAATAIHNRLPRVPA